MTLEIILKHIKDVPDNRLEELYKFVQTLNAPTKTTETLRKKILSFGGSFSDMSESEYEGFINHTKKTRENLFDRKVNL